jgi:hypothetical protein
MFKIEIEYEVDGKRYKDPSKAAGALTASLMQTVGEQVADQLSRVRCPEHGDRPKVRIVSQSTDQIEFQIHGCCEQLVAAAESQLQ